MTPEEDIKRLTSALGVQKALTAKARRERDGYFKQLKNEQANRRVSDLRAATEETLRREAFLQRDMAVAAREVLTEALARATDAGYLLRERLEKLEASYSSLREYLTGE